MIILSSESLRPKLARKILKNWAEKQFRSISTIKEIEKNEVYRPNRKKTEMGFESGPPS